MKKLEAKIPPAMLFILAAISIWIISKYTAGFEIKNITKNSIVTLITITGLIFGFSGIISFKKSNTSVDPTNPESADTLVSSGIYRVSRNPMYLSLVFLLIAMVLYLESLWSIIVVCLFVVYMNRFQIIPEERAMIKLFGNEYVDYMQRVRKWI